MVDKGDHYRGIVHKKLLSDYNKIWGTNNEIYKNNVFMIERGQMPGQLGIIIPAYSKRYIYILFIYILFLFFKIKIKYLW